MGTCCIRFIAAAAVLVVERDGLDQLANVGSYYFADLVTFLLVTFVLLAARVGCLPWSLQFIVGRYKRNACPTDRIHL